jgi:hypothetical protein
MSNMKMAALNLRMIFFEDMYYFHVSIDILLSVDVQKIPIEDLLKLGDRGYCYQ